MFKNFITIKVNIQFITEPKQNPDKTMTHTKIQEKTYNIGQRESCERKRKPTCAKETE